LNRTGCDRKHSN